jgi:excinuclease ABC subunit B
VLALRQQMFAAAENLQFETAARLRDEIRKLQAQSGGEIALPAAEPVRAPAKAAKKGAAYGRKRR